MKRISSIVLAGLSLTGGNPVSPWNDAHPSSGCSQENLRSTGGDGLFYCFAAD